MGSQQRTLFTLSKVVRLDASTVCFTPADIAALRDTLLDATRSKHDLLCALRKLDCYRLEAGDLLTSGIGGAVATLAAGHPKPDVSRFAAALLVKLRAVAERGLFPRLPYDGAEAAAAPDGTPQTPEEAIALAAQAARAARRARRLAADAELLGAGSPSSSEDEREEGAGDAEWRPGRGANAGATPPPASGPEGGVVQHALAARYAPDSAFRRTRTGSRVPVGAEQGADGRLYRQATLAAAFGRPRGPAPGTAKADPPSAMVLEEDLVVVEGPEAMTVDLL